jgi:hypothetical protein
VRKSRYLAKASTQKNSMKKDPTSKRCLFNSGILLAFALCSAGVVLAMASITGWREAGPTAKTDSRQPYMPLPGGEPDDLDRLEVEWTNRLTYPTGVFDPAWIRLAAAKDSFIARSVPAGLPSRLNRGKSPLALSANSFTALGPKPEHMTGCTGCYDCVTTEGC